MRFTRGLQKLAESTEEQGHTKSILSVAVSPSGKYVATGGEDNKLIIWDASTLKPLQTFTQHRDSVSGLAFARHISSMTSGEQLFTGSFDRTIKTWSVSSSGHAYVETLFGHQDNVASVAAMAIDQCISVGARDRTARLWKVVEESQLIFRGGSSKNTYHENNMDCIAPLPPTHFVTGSDNGSISLWSLHKKKPLHTIPQAHGVDPTPPLEDHSPEEDRQTAESHARFLRPTPRWITALTSVPGTDIVLSGSWDGWVRAWKISEDKKAILPLGPVGGGTLSSTTDGPDTPSKQLEQGLASANPPHRQSLTAVNNNQHGATEFEPLVKGVVNGIAVFERRAETAANPKSKSNTKTQTQTQTPPAPEARGLCIAVAVGKEHRLGRWKCYANNYHKGPTPEGRNGAMIFEVPFSAPETLAQRDREE